MSFYGLIGKNQNKLNESELVLLNTMMEYGELLEHCSVRRVADDCYVAPNTIIRMCKKLGFQGYTEFKNTFIQQQRPGGGQYPPGGDDILQQLVRSRQLIGDGLMNSIVDAIHDSYKLALFSSGLSRFITGELEERFRLAGRKVHSFSERDLKVHCANRLTARDCAVVFSVSGETASSVEALQIAKARDVKIISITGISNNTIARLADYAVFVPCEPFSLEEIDMTDRLPFAYAASLLFSRYAEKYLSGKHSE